MVGNFILRPHVNRAIKPNLNAVIPSLMHLFIFSVEKMYYLHKVIVTSAASCVKPNASQ